MLISWQRVCADEFTYLDVRNRTMVTNEARLLGSDRGLQVLEKADGRLDLVPTAAIVNRIPKDDPTPITPSEMGELLKEKFGPELVRLEIDKPFVVAMVLSAPLEKPSEAKAQVFLRKASRFMKNVDSVFLRYARTMKFPLKDPLYPLVLVIFESDDDFNTYTAEVTSNRGLSATSILGFYSQESNWLAVRMSSCDSFEVPLHEAIHLQMYNRVFTRLIPVPKWFDEGIATGFEGNGERIDVNPAKINSRYAATVMQKRQGSVDWRTIVSADDAFNADILAGDAYTLAWCLHWMLVTQHREQYQQYVKELSQRKPLESLQNTERVEHFESVFNKSIAEMQKAFPGVLQTHVKRQNINLAQREVAGRANQQQALGEYDVQAVRLMSHGGLLQVNGTLKNISPLRAMSFYVTVETESGVYADWLLHDVKPGERKALVQQIAAKVIPGMSGGSPETFRVLVRSAPAASEIAQKWNRGQVPGPLTGR
ncbi:DUF1570 domain-containing protein [Planctomicrobium sp. SH664]|uniref:DUF1570 domain-containing protein n=1 Tax=Planctomicrobium sp. SH664 TaxID=3448125 RepID=UPI003F5B28ED